MNKDMYIDDDAGNITEVSGSNCDDMVEQLVIIKEDENSYVRRTGEFRRDVGNEVETSNHKNNKQTLDDIIQNYEILKQNHEKNTQKHETTIAQTHEILKQNHGNIKQTLGDITQTHEIIKQNHEKIKQILDDIIQNYE